MAADPYKYFRIESREILEGLGKGVLELERSEQPKDVVARLFRLAHTLKGAARVVRQRDVAELAHAMEDALEPLREGTERASRVLVDELLTMIDAMTAKVAALGAPEAAPSATEERPRAAAAPREEPLRGVRADSNELDRLVEGVTELGSELAAVRRGANALEAARRTSEILRQRLAFRALESHPGSSARLRATVDELLALLAGASRDVSQGLERFERELAQVSDAAERLRLSPASTTFGALERALRDAAVATGRRATLETSGGDVRLDPELLSAVQAALVQAVRNAVAHGLEPEAERKRSGKPEAGAVRVEVTRAGGRVRFVCRDDGRGVDFEAVRRSALEKGHAESELDDGAVLELLLSGGISTSREVTALSGRGVGLDVIRETAARLGGRARLSSKRGEGTTLELVVPASRSALDALLVEAEGEIAAIPLEAVRRTLRAAPGDLARSAEGDSIVLEGRVIPFAPLARSLCATERARPSRSWSVVLVQGASGLAAVGVDRLLGTETIVSRPLPAAMPGHAAVGGAALDADGNPRLVLDPDGLVASVENTAPAVADVASPRVPILVIDDSLTTRMLEQSILESAGYAVELATSAEEALEKAKGRRYGLFLVDVEMPGIDGFTFVERTRADTKLREVPCILVSSRASADDRRRGIDAGASAYIVKGEFDQGELLARIRKLLG